MSFTAKSVILDIADAYPTADLLGIRAIDFWFEGSKIPNVYSTNFVAYATTVLSTSFYSRYTFGTPLSKTGNAVGTQWYSGSGQTTNQRLICVFNSETEFDEIRINNSHSYGGTTNRGALNVKINTSSDAITSTVYDEAIANSTLIYDGTFDEHVGSDVEDEQTLALIAPWDGTVTTPEILIPITADSNLQINVSSPELSIPIIVSDPVIFAGVILSTPEISIPITADIPAINIGIATTEAVIPVVITSDIKIGIVQDEIALNVLVGDPVIFTGILVESPEISIPIMADSNISITIAPTEAVIPAVITSNISINIGSEEIIIPIDASGPNISTFSMAGTIVRYLLTITGAADGTTDFTLPMSSFQARRKSGDPTYLSVVVPTLDYATEIADRSNGTIKVEQAYALGGEYVQRELILEAEIDNIKTYEGGKNQSVVLEGYKTTTYTTKLMTLTTATYRALSGGKLRYRVAETNVFLNPGDTVTIGDDTFIIGTMAYSISPTEQQIELEEA